MSLQCQEVHAHSLVLPAVILNPCVIFVFSTKFSGNIALPSHASYSIILQEGSLSTSKVEVPQFGRLSFICGVTIFHSRSTFKANTHPLHLLCWDTQDLDNGGQLTNLQILSYMNDQTWTMHRYLIHNQSSSVATSVFFPLVPQMSSAFMTTLLSSHFSSLFAFISTWLLWCQYQSAEFCCFCADSFSTERNLKPQKLGKSACLTTIFSQI